MPLESKNRTILINGNQIKPGENRLVKINISRLPTGTLIDIPVHVFNAKKPGPTVLLQAGLHGDEINGVETLRRMLEHNDFNIEKGAVIVVPILNIFGFIHFSRDVPDGKDVNRSFPGTKSGSLASRIAYHYTNEILPQIDFGIDLHTGGGQRHNYPHSWFF
jgi:predicted deacylase